MYNNKPEEQIQFQSIYQEARVNKSSLFKNPFFWIAILFLIIILLSYLLTTVLIREHRTPTISIKEIIAALPTKA